MRSYLLMDVPRAAAGEHSYPINIRDSYRPFDVVPAEIKLQEGPLSVDKIRSRGNDVNSIYAIWPDWFPRSNSGSCFYLFDILYKRVAKVNTTNGYNITSVAHNTRAIKKTLANLRAHRNDHITGSSGPAMGCLSWSFRRNLIAAILSLF